MKTQKDFFQLLIMGVLMILLWGVTIHAQPAEIFVDDNATGVQDGSRDHPFRTIMQGINAASAGQTVIVLPGTYHENVVMKDGVNLIGSSFEVTIIDGRSGWAVTCTGIGAGTTLAGFTITNGSVGILCTSSSLTIRDNYITNLDLSSTSADGIRLDDSSPLIRNNVIYRVGGMGIRGQGNSQPRIINNTIMDYRYYAGIAFAALNIGTVTPTVKNNIIVRGNAEPVGGILWSSPARVSVSYNDVVDPANVTGTGSYYSYHDGTRWIEVSGGPGAISADPMFADRARGDFHLLLPSPCRDAGDPNPIYNDLDGTRNDMGAFGGVVLAPGQNFHSGSGFVFTTIGKIPVRTDTGWQIVQDPAHPSHGLVRVSNQVANDFHIPRYTDAPLGGYLWISGLFGASDDVDYYQILVTPIRSRSSFELNDPLTKYQYTINPDGTVTTTRVQLGPQTIGGVSNLYQLNKGGYWTYPDLRIIWNTTGRNGKYTLTYRAYRMERGALMPVTLPGNEQDHITMVLDNTPVVAQINSVKYSDGVAIAECENIHLPHAGSQALVFNITAYHPNGYLDFYDLDCYWGFNRPGGTFASGHYPSPSESPPIWHGFDHQEMPPLLPRDEHGAVMSWTTCAYRFRLYVRARTTDGYNYINGAEFNAYFSVAIP
jgi:parallel beta-helix repeat protein